jgi:hypothetical protein
MKNKLLFMKYDVYKAVAKEKVDVFESITAPTKQGTYETNGGAIQTLLLDESKWDITKIKTITPNF